MMVDGLWPFLLPSSTGKAPPFLTIEGEAYGRASPFPSQSRAVDGKGFALPSPFSHWKGSALPPQRGRSVGLRRSLSTAERLKGRASPSLLRKGGAFLWKKGEGRGRAKPFPSAARLCEGSGEALRFAFFVEEEAGRSPSL